MNNDEVKVKVSHMTKKFGDLLVLDDISFEVKKGEFLCVVGPVSYTHLGAVGSRCHPGL